MTGAFGARLMLSAAEYEIGTHAALAALVQHAPGCDAAIVGHGVKPVARPETEPMIAPELGGISAPLAEAIRRRSRRGLS